LNHGRLGTNRAFLGTLIALFLIPIASILYGPHVLLLLPFLVYVLDFLEADALITRRWESGSITPLLVPAPYKFPVRKKCNLNVLIVGTSGKGKTNLLDYLVSKYFENFVVFCFKENDLHLNLNASIIDVSKYGPFDKESFVDAFMLTFQPKIIGEIVSRYAGVLIGVVARSSELANPSKELG